MRAVIKYLKPGNQDIESGSICNFLGWPLGRVRHSLHRINAIESKEVDKQAVESLPTVKASTAFASAVRGKDLTTGQQRRVAKRIAESENYSRQAVKLAVEKEAAPEPTKQDVEDKQQRQMMIAFDDYLASIAVIASNLKYEVQKMRGIKSMIRNYNPDQYENRLTLKLSLDGLQKAIINTLNTLDNE